MGLIVNAHIVKMGWNPDNGRELGVRVGEVAIPLVPDQYRYRVKLGQPVNFVTDRETGLAILLFPESRIGGERER